MPNPIELVPSPHPADHPDNKMWIYEQIWGHRIWDSQSHWLVFLEFLCVAEACLRDGKLLDPEGALYPLKFKMYKRMALRNILFNDESLFQIAAKFPDSVTAWTHWLKGMEDRARGAQSRDFSYLRDRFPSFHEFASLVGMLRASVVESDSNRRWSSRFVFPFGPNALYEDFNVNADGKVGKDYNNFGRSGEMLYKMLCGSTYAAELGKHLHHLISGSNPWNTLLGLMQPGDQDDLSSRGDSYLPYRRHPCFDRLGEDWLRVMEQGLPGFDAYPCLVTLGTLHLMLYQLTIAAGCCGSSSSPHFVCEIVAPKKTLVRELAGASYQQNNLLSLQAVDTYISNIAESDEWKKAAAEPGGFDGCRRLLEQLVRWGGEPEDYEGCADPDALLRELRRSAAARHRQHAGSVHRNYGRDVGLISKRGTNRLRYAPTDDLLRALILANVKQRMEFHEFLALLHARYGFVFGEREAELVLEGGTFDKTAFKQNARRLEQRLASLGMLRRLSDACAYVQNPFYRKSR
jgi:hypothetical protein